MEALLFNKDAGGKLFIDCVWCLAFLLFSAALNWIVDCVSLVICIMYCRPFSFTCTTYYVRFWVSETIILITMYEIPVINLWLAIFWIVYLFIPDSIFKIFSQWICFEWIISNKETSKIFPDAIQNFNA